MKWYQKNIIGEGRFVCFIIICIITALIFRLAGIEILTINLLTFKEWSEVVYYWSAGVFLLIISIWFGLNKWKLEMGKYNIFIKPPSPIVNKFGEVHSMTIINQTNMPLYNLEVVGFVSHKDLKQLIASGPVESKIITPQTIKHVALPTTHSVIHDLSHFNANIPNPIAAFQKAEFILPYAKLVDKLWIIVRSATNDCIAVFHEGKKFNGEFEYKNDSALTIVLTSPPSHTIPNF